MNISGKPIFPNREVIHTLQPTSVVSNAIQADVCENIFFQKVTFFKP